MLLYTFPIFGSWRYFWIRDEKKNNPNYSQPLQSFLLFLQEKPFASRLGTAPKTSIDALCDFVDLHEGHEFSTGVFQIHDIHELVENIRTLPDVDADSPLWSLARNMVKCGVKQRMLSDSTMMTTRKQQVTDLCHYARQICEEVGQVKTKRVLFGLELLNFAYKYWLFEGFPKLEPFSEDVQTRLATVLGLGLGLEMLGLGLGLGLGLEEHVLEKQDNLFVRMKMQYDMKT